MPTQGWNQTLVTQRTAGTLNNTYTTAKSVLNAQDVFGFYANYFQLGSKLRITVCGAVSNIVTTPGTITFEVRLAGGVVWSSGAVQLNATAHTTLPFKLVVDLTCQLTNTAATGPIAKFMGLGVLKGVMFTKTAGQTDGANTETVITVPVTAPALGGAFDSTTSQTLDFYVGFSTSNIGNGVRIDQVRRRSVVDARQLTGERCAMGFLQLRTTTPAQQTAQLAGTANLVVTVAANLGATTTMAAAAVLVVTTSAALTTVITMGASAQLLQVTVSAALTATVTMAAAARLVITTVGDLAGGTAQLSATALLQVTIAAALTATVTMAASVLVRVTTTADLTTQTPGPGNNFFLMF